MRISDWSSDVCSSDLRFRTIGDALVLAEHIADFTPAYADVPSRHVRIFAQVAVKFSHEGLAESHDFAIRAAARIGIGPALAAADRPPGQRSLEGLFEHKEFNDAQVDGGVTSDAHLLGAGGALELPP